MEEEEEEETTTSLLQGLKNHIKNEKKKNLKSNYLPTKDSVDGTFDYILQLVEEIISKNGKETQSSSTTSTSNTSSLSTSSFVQRGISSDISTIEPTIPKLSFIGKGLDSLNSSNISNSTISTNINHNTSIPTSTSPIKSAYGSTQSRPSGPVRNFLCPSGSSKFSSNSTKIFSTHQSNTTSTTTTTGNISISSTTNTPSSSSSDVNINEITKIQQQPDLVGSFKSSSLIVNSSQMSSSFVTNSNQSTNLKLQIRRNPEPAVGSSEVLSNNNNNNSKTTTKKQNVLVAESYDSSSDSDSNSSEPSPDYSDISENFSSSNSEFSDDDLSDTEGLLETNPNFVFTQAEVVEVIQVGSNHIEEEEKAEDFEFVDDIYDPNDDDDELVVEPHKIKNLQEIASTAEESSNNTVDFAPDGTPLRVIKLNREDVFSELLEVGRRFNRDDYDYCTPFIEKISPSDPTYFKKVCTYNRIVYAVVILGGYPCVLVLTVTATGKVERCVLNSFKICRSPSWARYLSGVTATSKDLVVYAKAMYLVHTSIKPVTVRNWPRRALKINCREDTVATNVGLKASPDKFKEIDKVFVQDWEKMKANLKNETIIKMTIDHQMKAKQIHAAHLLEVGNPAAANRVLERDVFGPEGTKPKKWRKKVGPSFSWTPRCFKVPIKNEPTKVGCIKCYAIFDNYALFAKHYRTRHPYGDRMIKRTCKTCQRVFKSARRLGNHRRKFCGKGIAPKPHGGQKTLPRVVKPDGTEKFVCVTCKGEFKNANTLGNHRRKFCAKGVEPKPRGRQKKVSTNA